MRRCLVILAITSLTSGCATMSPRSSTNHEAVSWPTKDRLRHACVNALRSPGTWAPAAGAALMAVDDWDRKASNWAVEKTPLFGSPRQADELSDKLRTATHLGMITTALLTDGERPVWKVRLQRLLVEEAGSWIALDTTNLLKEATQRERPDGSDNASFPSGHSTKAFSYATFASRNLELTELSQGARTGLNIGLFTLAGATGWARVEAGKHYPSDVLAGAALGHFMAMLLTDSFLRDHDAVTVDVELRRDGASFNIGFPF